MATPAMRTTVLSLVALFIYLLISLEITMVSDADKFDYPVYLQWVVALVCGVLMYLLAIVIYASFAYLVRRLHKQQRLQHAIEMELMANELQERNQSYEGFLEEASSSSVQRDDVISGAPLTPISEQPEYSTGQQTVAGHQPAVYYNRGLVVDDEARATGESITIRRSVTPEMSSFV